MLNRRSFLGFLGGVFGLAATPAAIAAAPKTNPITVDEWDEGGVHHIRLTSDEDVPVGFYFSSPDRKGNLFVPVVHADPAHDVRLQRLAEAPNTSHVTVVTHVFPGDTSPKIGIVTTVQPLRVEHMHLLVPFRFTTAA